jgi:hypothetical protein
MNSVYIGYPQCHLYDKATLPREATKRPSNGMSLTTSCLTATYTTTPSPQWHWYICPESKDQTKELTSASSQPPKLECSKTAIARASDVDATAQLRTAFNPYQTPRHRDPLHDLVSISTLSPFFLHPLIRGPQKPHRSSTDDTDTDTHSSRPRELLSSQRSSHLSSRTILH